jgi:multiple sugar transport system substrate-binding protein
LTLRGLTWDHPRGYGPLETLGGPVVWQRQPLEGFESHPIEQLAERYDLLIIDHPGVGEAVAAGCLMPMDELFGVEELAQWKEASVGRTFESYSYENRQWALPIDAATQVCVIRTDLLGVASVPATWDQVIELSKRVTVCLPLGGPHALLTFMGICLALGEQPASREGVLVGEKAGLAALDIMTLVLGDSSPELFFQNPIGIQETMASTDRVALCPLVYGYATYSGSSPPGCHRLTAADAPGAPPGTVLGGTGMAVSRRASAGDQVLAYLRRAMAEPVQTDLFPRAGGQPSARAAWIDEQVNERFGSFYRNTLRSVESAWIRPRYPGWIAFQADGSRLIREGLIDGVDHRRLLSDLQGRYQRSRTGT